MLKKALIVLLVVLSLILLAQRYAHHGIRLWAAMPEFTHQQGERFTTMVAAKDGIKLSTRVFQPKGKGPWPSILMRNPYSALDLPLDSLCQLFVGYGYSCVIQHTRGQGDSEGEWEPIMNEPDDGSATLYWLAEQEWVDGNIGMWGISYLALVQWAAAFDAPPELKALVPISMGTDLHHAVYENGAFRHFATWWMLVIPDDTTKFWNALTYRFMNAVRYLPHNKLEEKYSDVNPEWYQQWISSAEKAAPIWQRDDAARLYQVAESLTIPALLISGWYDPFFSVLYRDYLQLGSQSSSAMVIGPWNHTHFTVSDLAPYPISAEESELNNHSQKMTKAALRMSLSWFEQHLKANDAVEKVPPVAKVYDLGIYEWLSYDEWPPETFSVNFNLKNFESAKDCKGVLAKQKDHSLNSLNPFQAESASYVFDPENPVITKGGSAFIFPTSSNIQAGSFFQGDICKRDDVLSFISEPLAEEFTIVGESKIILQVSSSAEDTMFTAKLLDVQPDGRAVNIRDSATTLSLRNGVRQTITYEPNSVVEVAIDLWATHWTLKKGHSLRLDISSSNLPAYHLHSNFAGPWYEQEKRQTAKQTIFSPSRIELPVKTSANK